MIGSIAAIIIYLGIVYLDLWEMIPPGHRWWIGVALVLMFLWGPAERTVVIKKVIS